ncbi:hypothetical protein RFI_31267 [Reticulomyxa filosa]|uniref:Uncharacterized protein n=1 Tax=Reticulomyxa filosa TaxID=46433 RepID=X6LWX8_RETFI|nr:hypothetical protein RFI_31267 [Reticulomyxa filosa]|eukprot:ETO06129.1 hypothetical protein RFI_31267 [Reticulomyxa filosa]
MEMGPTYVGHDYCTSADDNHSQNIRTCDQVYLYVCLCIVNDIDQLFEWMFNIQPLGPTAQDTDSLPIIVWIITVQNAHVTIMKGSSIVCSYYVLSSSSKLTPHLIKLLKANEQVLEQSYLPGCSKLLLRVDRADGNEEAYPNEQIRVSVDDDERSRVEEDHCFNEDDNKVKAMKDNDNDTTIDEKNRKNKGSKKKSKYKYQYKC